MKNKCFSSSSDLYWIENLIQTELEIRYCIEYCNRVQKTSSELIQKLLKNDPQTMLTSISTAVPTVVPLPYTSKTNENFNVILPFINDVLHSMRIRMERNLKNRITSKNKQNSMLKTSVPCYQKLSKSIKQSIKIQQLCEKAKILQSKLHENMKCKEKTDTMIHSISNSFLKENDSDDISQSKSELKLNENAIAKNIECMQLLEEERVQQRLEIAFIEKSICKIHQKIAKEYGLKESIKQHRKISAPMKKSMKIVLKKKQPSLINIACQTSSALTAWTNDIFCQTKTSSAQKITLSTDTNSLWNVRTNKKIALSNQRSIPNMNIPKEIYKKLAEQSKIALVHTSERNVNSNQSPLERKTHIISNGKYEIIVEDEQQHTNNNGYCWMRQDFELPTTALMSNDMKLYLARWYLNIGSIQYCLEMQYSNDITIAPRIWLNKREILFQHSLDIFRRIKTNKNYWRILLKIHRKHICIRAVNKIYAMFIDGISFQQIQQSFSKQKWNQPIL